MDFASTPQLNHVVQPTVPEFGLPHVPKVGTDIQWPSVVGSSVVGSATS